MWIINEWTAFLCHFVICARVRVSISRSGNSLWFAGNAMHFEMVKAPSVCGGVPFANQLAYFWLFASLRRNIFSFRWHVRESRVRFGSDSISSMNQINSSIRCVNDVDKSSFSSKALVSLTRFAYKYCQHFHFRSYYLSSAAIIAFDKNGRIWVLFAFISYLTFDVSTCAASPSPHTLRTVCIRGTACWVRYNIFMLISDHFNARVHQIDTEPINIRIYCLLPEHENETKGSWSRWWMVVVFETLETRTHAFVLTLSAMCELCKVYSCMAFARSWRKKNEHGFDSTE